ncbi:mechanosensitive ion channel family protein [Echinimonas agarilytica]|uniref:Small-conductance mechanosensitive channel n=1 Tax=Echinimonas agarilytica TaxID=1215918 RepID=A0AA41W8V1_9GAMM|nr:mechanosensitive ion channel domain-containing protein [Echinimonas agarilytica]MCM2680249.1 mechanosensitive ion channel [Echinimonas agarilytica]
MELEQYMDQAVNLTMAYLPKVLLAIVFLWIGMWVIKRVTKLFDIALEKKDVEASLRGFLGSMVSALLKVALIISVATMVGIEMTAFIAVLGAAGLAVGMALSGTLQNFAGGVIILLFKPFRVGDFIEAQGYMGTVSEIQIFITILKTPDNKTIIIPNSPLSTGSLINFSIEQTRRVDFSFGIGYGDDIDQARGIINEIVQADARVKKDPEPFIMVGELADSSVNLTVRVWVDAADYWGVHFDTIEAVKKAFDAKGVSIPFPQQDVHMHQVSNG